MLTSILKKFWGYDSFRSNQKAIIESVVSGRDTMVILPTGGGKSLCYQLPALVREGTAIVVSPLIALMKGQVDSLKRKNIAAEFINSSLTKERLTIVKEKVLSSSLNLLYLAPETLNHKSTLAMLRQIKVSFIAIDEAHCISDWGHDFRPKYRKLSHTIEQIGSVPVIALTATATIQIQKDIVRNLNMKDPAIFIDSFDRPNLSYEVQPKINVEKKIVQFIKQRKNVGIVYCQRKKEANEIARLLQHNQINAAVYHAGLDDDTRNKSQDDFLCNKIDVIVATIAFGMGIDKPDIRFVIHHSIPRSLESYYQQTGRAGRDGKPSHCLLFYDPNDVAKLEYLNKNKPVAERDKLTVLLKDMDTYALTGGCRRKQLLHYFGEHYAPPCNNCDNCLRPGETFEGKTLMQQLLRAVQLIDEKHEDEYVLDVLAGVRSADIVDNKHDKIPCFGKGKRDVELLNPVLRQGFLLGYLTRDIEDIASVKLTKLGSDFIKKPHALTLYKEHRYTTTDTAEANGKNTLVDKVLLQELEVLVQAEAKKHKLKPYLIFQPNMLENMATYYPTSIQELATMRGIGLTKAQKFGPPFVALIAGYVEGNDIAPVTSVIVRSAGSKHAIKRQIVQYVDRKMSLDMIAKITMLSRQELLRQLEDLANEGVRLKLDYHINEILTPEQQKDLYDYFAEAEEDNIALACDELEEDYNEEQVRLMHLKFLSEVSL